METATSDVNVVLQRAEKKFSDLDVSLNGTLEGSELLELASWVFDSFHPEGQPMSAEQRQAEAHKLLSRLDKNDDGVMDFEEFTGWFERTCGSISKFDASRQQRLGPNAGQDASCSQEPETKSGARDEARRRKLKQIFDMFDLNGSGRIDKRELLELGKARRALGQKAGEWTQEQNQKLLAAMDLNADGSISANEFIDYFDASCPLNPEQFEATMMQFSSVAQRCSLLKTPLRMAEMQPQQSPRQLFVTTPGRSPRAMMPAGSRANTVLNAARGIFDAANKTQNDVLQIEEIRFLARQSRPLLSRLLLQVWQIRGITDYTEEALSQQVERALVTYGTGEQFVTFMQFLRMVTKHPWHLLLPSELQSQLGVKSPSKGLPITPRERMSPQPGNSPDRRSPSKLLDLCLEMIGSYQESAPLLHDDLNLSEAKASRRTPTSVPPLQVGTMQDAGSNMEKLLPKIREMFDWLDKDKSGALESDELLNLAEWVFESFHPGGEPLGEEQKQVEADKLLKRLDKNADRCLSFEEFEGWCKRTAASVVAFAHKQKSKGAHGVWAYKDETVAKGAKHGASLVNADTYKSRVQVDIGASVHAWNAAAGSIQLLYNAAEALFRKYDPAEALFLSEVELVAMVRGELWDKRNIPMPKENEAEIHQHAKKVISEVDFLDGRGISFPSFVRMLVVSTRRSTKGVSDDAQPWVALLPKKIVGELNTLVKSGVPHLRFNPRRETGADPTVSGAPHQVVKRVMEAVDQLFDQIAGSSTALIDLPKMLAYLIHFFGDSLEKPDVFTTSVMLMCDRIVQGGLCKADFTRVVIREPFCAILPPSVLEDVYYLIDLATQRGGSDIAPQDPAVAVPPSAVAVPPQVKPPSDQIQQSDKHMEQAKRELCRAAQAGGLQTVFGSFDSDKNGFIDGREFIALAHELAKKMVLDPRGRLSESDARAAVYSIIKRIDVNCDGRVSFKEFEEFVTAYDGKEKDPLPAAAAVRQDKLRQVFKAFDINGDGTIGADELLKLGQARRRLGQKQGEWTAEMNRRMLARMDGDGDGRVVEQEFATFFDDLLPRDMHEFDTNIKQFMDVAVSVRQTAVARNDPLAGQESSAASKDPLAGQESSARPSPTKQDVSPQPLGVSPPARAPRRYREPEMPDREKKLREVFQAFDLDGDGAIGAEELLVLGQQRRKLGQQSGEWTKDMNARLVKKLDRNGDGKVLVHEFVEFFDEQLPSLNSMFYHHCDAFLRVAQSLAKAPVPEVPAAAKGRARAMQEAIKNIAVKEELTDRRAAERRLMQDPSLPVSSGDAPPTEEKSKSYSVFGKPAETVVQKDWSAERQAGETFYKIGSADAPKQQQAAPKNQGAKDIDSRDLTASARAGKVLHGRDEMANKRGSTKPLSAAERAEAILYGTGQSAEWDVRGERSVSASPEFKQEVDGDFDKWDENGDGVIDREEFTKMRIAFAHKEAERIRSEARSMSRSMSTSRSPARSTGKLGAMKNAVSRAEEDEF